MARQIALGGHQHILALGRPFSSKVGIGADNQPLTREVRAGDGRHIALIEPGKLDGSALYQLLDRERTQASDPVTAGGSDILGVSRLGDRAAIANQYHTIEARSLLQRGNLGRQRCGVTGVAVEDHDRDRAAIGDAEQARDDLQGAPAAIASVSTLGQRTAAALHVVGGTIMEHRRAVLQVSVGQGGP